MKQTIAHLGLEYEINGEPTPLIQALGTVKGRDFYFRARHPNWVFEMANDFGESPSDVGGNQILRIEGWYSSKNAMTHEEANRIIERCAEMFVDLISF